MRLPREFTEIVWGTNDGLRRTIRYKTSSSGSWTNVDLSAATAVYLYLINVDGTVVHEFEGVGDDAALFSLGATGTLVFTPAAATFAAADEGTYLLWIKVVDATWTAGKTFKSTVGVRIVNVDLT